MYSFLAMMCPFTPWLRAFGTGCGTTQAAQLRFECTDPLFGLAACFGLCLPLFLGLAACFGLYLPLFLGLAACFGLFLRLIRTSIASARDSIEYAQLCVVVNY